MTTSPNSRPFPLLLACGLAQMIVVVDYFAAAVALPSMAESFGVTADSLQWVLTGYLLSFSAVLGIAGPLGDRYGRKKLLLVGIVLFGAISIWVGLANSVSMLITSRIALGIGGGLLLPLSTAVISVSVTREKLPKMISILTGISTIGMAIGPVVGGVLTEQLSWRWVFFVNIPITVIAFFAVIFCATESRDPQSKGSVDIWGIVLLLGGLSLLAVGVAGIPNWTLLQWLGTTLAGVVCLIAFTLVELWVKIPIIDLRMLGNRTFSGYLVGGTLSNSCWCILIFGTTMYLQKVIKDDAMVTGFIFLFMSASVATASFIAPVIQHRIGTRTLLLVALAIQSLACLAFWVDHAQPWLSIGLLFVGFGCSWGWSMSQAGAIATIPQNKSGLAAGSILTVMIMAGNMAVVVTATLIEALGGTGATNYEPGISTSYLLAVAMVVVGFIATLLIVPKTDPAHASPTEP